MNMMDQPAHSIKPIATTSHEEANEILVTQQQVNSCNYENNDERFSCEQYDKMNILSVDSENLHNCGSMGKISI
jgi:hypothetical protein